MLVEAAAVEQASKLEKPTSICKCQHYLSAFCAPSHGHHQVECLIATNQETSCNVTLCPALFSAVLEREGLVLTLLPTSDGFLLLISKWTQACAARVRKAPKTPVDKRCKRRPPAARNRPLRWPARTEPASGQVTCLGSRLPLRVGLAAFARFLGAPGMMQNYGT